MRIGFSTGYTETYWGSWFQEGKQLGGSERICVEVASALAAQGHLVTVRLPYDTPDLVHRNVRWIGLSSSPQRYDALFLLDDFDCRDGGDVTALVACRSDPPPHTDFDKLIFLSKHHAKLMGHEGSPTVGGGVDVSHYREVLGAVQKRTPRRVACTSSPDRCPKARDIGRAFDFVHTYKKVPGYETTEVSREELIQVQLQAQVLIYPYEPTRESDFFSMAVLESLAAGTPAIISDGESLTELWGNSAIVLPRPIRLSQWHMQIEELLENKDLWQRYSDLGRQTAANYTWEKQAARYLAVATEA